MRKIYSKIAEFIVMFWDCLNVLWKFVFEIVWIVFKRVHYLLMVGTGAYTLTETIVICKDYEKINTVTLQPVLINIALLSVLTAAAYFIALGSKRIYKGYN